MECKHTHRDHTFIDYTSHRIHNESNLIGKNKMRKNRKSPFPRPEYRTTNGN